MGSTAIVWFRNDLRVSDHEPLHEACKNFDHVIPLYIYDERFWAKSRVANIPCFSGHRFQFLTGCLENLRETLKEIGGDLIVRKGKPEEIIPALCREFEVSKVFFHEEVTNEETSIEKSLIDQLNNIDCKTKTFWNSTLAHVDDIPFEDIHWLPDIFTEFRKKTEKNCDWRLPISAPDEVNLPEDIETDELLTFEEACFPKPPSDTRSALHNMRPGEKGAWERLGHYFWGTESLAEYKQTRNGMVGNDYSSKFSPYLAHGCISPRSIAAEVSRFEKEVKKNSSTYWLIFELLWRDFFRFIALKYGDKIFKRGGVQGRNLHVENSEEKFQAWINGQTGYPLVDANMREIHQTGFMSNRGRQNVASFLVRDLKIDWRWGAEYFESQLVDYDPCSNWGNWTYAAGVGNDPREDRYFNVVGQGKRYDPEGDYYRLWLKELSELPKKYIHEPWMLDADLQKRYKVKIGKDYPSPIVTLQNNNRENSFGGNKRGRKRR